ncbi:hypothetical protein GPECTOR_152g51 [Gonium pectorale]|uniref:cellulase n=1 Tax=Gonium pectorale TaxID=33097 RepID=A0A150FXR9_GONPE|nr:hypothetical protein GPECTOR_152g51 [Gonium pectorale]|eukprot:KXZ42396.1 hypothetical protein GPECTOR_152g51 [Gonium pectorale]
MINCYARDSVPLGRFFEAQMSGDVPPWSYAYVKSWRTSSFASEGALSKGFFTDGGHLKSSLTMASSASLLAFSALTWRDSLVESGNWDRVVRNVRWAADHLMACAANDGEFVAQIGDHFIEDSYWGPPETQTTERPVFVIKKGCGDGADVLSQAVAALTGAGLLLRLPGEHQDEDASNEFLAKAQVLWDEWASTLESVWQAPEGNNTVVSRTHSDDKAWAAAWLCKRARVLGSDGASAVCDDAADRWTQLRLGEGYLTTDNYHAAALLLLLDTGAGSSADGDTFTANLLTHYLDRWVVKPGSVQECDCNTPSSGGLCSIDGSYVVQEGGPGVSQFTANMAFVALAAAHVHGPDSAETRGWQCWARDQVNWLLGANGASQAYVTGLDEIAYFQSDVRIPTNPRHRGSACKDGVCAAPGEPNPNTLPGALLGGPERVAAFEDSRDAGPPTFVSIEYNAGFAAALMVGGRGLSAIEQRLAAEGTSWSAYCAAAINLHV